MSTACGTNTRVQNATYGGIHKASSSRTTFQNDSLKKKPVTLTWNGDNCSTVEISGLDIGWGQKIPLTYEEEEGLWVLHRELPEGRYEYKYIVDGEWLLNKDELVTPINKDGHINNYVQISDDNPDGFTAALRKRLTADDPVLTMNERLIIRQFLEACPDDE